MPAVGRWGRDECFGFVRPEDFEALDGALRREMEEGCGGVLRAIGISGDEPSSLRGLSRGELDAATGPVASGIVQAEANPVVCRGDVVLEDTQGLDAIGPRAEGERYEVGLTIPIEIVGEQVLGILGDGESGYESDVFQASVAEIEEERIVLPSPVGGAIGGTTGVGSPEVEVQDGVVGGGSDMDIVEPELAFVILG